eukprot:TRINITY_DN14995_c0_g1_i1.p1 TRINITY_DN14995_c0_g1~~TRINITY_DN14995_c0_g1_i1.p1  ORF type:complete len:152 (-),score=32.96 TRINITY_DN14995_c0_g1_i1:66-521(-)
MGLFTSKLRGRTFKQIQVNTSPPKREDIKHKDNVEKDSEFVSSINKMSITSRNPETPVIPSLEEQVDQLRHLVPDFDARMQRKAESQVNLDVARVGLLNSLGLRKLLKSHSQNVSQQELSIQYGIKEEDVLAITKYLSEPKIVLEEDETKH